MWDVIVIGGGLAGLVSALAAQSQGKSALLVSRGAGSLNYAAGVFDFGDIAGLSQKEQHPYALLGSDKVIEAAAFLRQILPDMAGGPNEKHLALTPLGELREASLVPRSMIADQVAKAKNITLLQPAGLKDFFPDVVQANLRRLFPQAEIRSRSVRPGPFQAWLQQGKSLTALEYASFWRGTEGRALLETLAESTDSADVFVLPGWGYRLGDSKEDFHFSKPIVEMSTFPPSAQGKVIYEKLVRMFKQRGGEVAFAEASGAFVEDRFCRGIWLKGKGKDALYRAKTYILATGGLLGGGIATEPAKARETVFNLPLFLPEAGDWSEHHFFSEQAYARIGIEVDQKLRPWDPQKTSPLIENVYVVGRGLAHWDPWTEHCAGGVSISSGYVAGLGQ